MMQATNTMPPRRSVWQAMWGELCYHKIDFLQLAAIAGGVYLLFFAIIGGGTFLLNGGVLEPELLSVLGLMPLSLGIIIITLVYGAQITVYHNMGVQMSIPRRQMIARSIWIGVLIQGCWVLCSVALYGVTYLIGQAVGCEIYPVWQESLPHVLWLLFFTIPLSFGTFGAAVLLRFGRKGFWCLYAVFIGAMVLPSAFPVLLEDSGPFGFVWEFFVNSSFSVTSGAFWFCALLMVAMFGAGVALLWRAPVRS